MRERLQVATRPIETAIKKNTMPTHYDDSFIINDWKLKDTNKVTLRERIISICFSFSFGFVQSVVLDLVPVRELRGLH